MMQDAGSAMVRSVSLRACLVALGKATWWLIVLPAAVTWLHLNLCLELANIPPRSVDPILAIDRSNDSMPFLIVVHGHDTGPSLSPTSSEVLRVQDKGIDVSVAGIYRRDETLVASLVSRTTQYRRLMVPDERSWSIGTLDVAAWLQRVDSYGVERSSLAHAEAEPRLEYRGGSHGWCFIMHTGGHTDKTSPRHQAISCGPSLLGTYHPLLNNSGALAPLIQASVRSFTGRPQWSTSKHERADLIEGTTSHPYLVSRHDFRRNPRKQASEVPGYVHPAMLAISEQPAALLLVVFQVLLAVAYRQFRVDPPSVAVLFSRMVHSFEAWRCFSGPMTHFESWHLFFNMTALYSLGQQLEGRNAKLQLSSLAFLLYNISLMPLTSLVWAGLQYVTRHFANRDRDEPGLATVGFSGVLFVWIVIASLEQESTCPIFFLPKVCFSTYSFGKSGGWLALKWSWAPLIQLLLAQAILPRVSLSGHLAGLLCGFCLHWGLLPPINWMQPAIIVPVLYWFHLLRARVIILGSKTSSIRTSQLDSSQYTKVKESTRHETLSLIFRWLLGVQIICLLPLIVRFYGSLRSLVVSRIFSIVFWFHLHRVINTTAAVRASKGTTALVTETMTRAYVVVAAFDAVTWAMSVGSWAFLACADPLPSFLLAIALAQCILLIVTLSVASTLLLSDQSGIFKYTLEYTVTRHTNIVGKWLLGRALAMSALPSQTSFDAGTRLVNNGPGTSEGLVGSPESDPLCRA